MRCLKPLRRQNRKCETNTLMCSCNQVRLSFGDETFLSVCKTLKMHIRNGTVPQLSEVSKMKLS